MTVSCNGHMSRDLPVRVRLSCGVSVIKVLVILLSADFINRTQRLR